MSKSIILKTIVSSFIFYLIFIGSSFFFNLIVFAKAHEVVTFFRSEDSFLASPGGLAITAVIWSILISCSYQVFGRHLKIEKTYLRGLAYGFLIFLFFIWQQELFYYQFIEFEIGILIGAILHMVIAFPIGCMFIAIIHEGKFS